ncbi:MAG: protein kinase domain-containing protein [Gemmataceae bacterium]
MPSNEAWPKTLVSPHLQAAELPSPLPPTVRARSGPEFEEAAQAYLEFRLLDADGHSRSLSSWRPSLDGCQRHVDLFREMHEADHQAAFNLAQAATALPSVGSDFLGFSLIEELGRGAFGKVFLARQGDLANRPVALKVATDIFGESQTLAQLQHTNIVPIYSIHRAGAFQAVCMPYFGATTLADVLQQVRNGVSLPASGKFLVSTLNNRKALTSRTDSSKPSRPSAIAPAQKPSGHESGDPTGLSEQAKEVPTLRDWEGMTYVEAVLSVGAQLADGLSHAHEHGILHLDLKPANVLLTDEGQPMLLDFNLSRDTKVRSAASASVGGTLQYMAPEHLEAFRDRAQPVDARSDIFALGVILYEMLTGRHPYPAYLNVSKAVLDDMLEDRHKSPPSLCRANQAASPAVEAIINRCLAPDPACRYQSAHDLHEDLERQLHDLPLKHTPEPSLRERGRKWIRRHPRLASMTTVGFVLGAVLVALTVSFIIRGQRLGQLQASENLHQFDDDMKTAQVLLYGRNSDAHQLDGGFAAARATLARYHVLDNAAWREQSAVRYLAPEDRDQLDDKVGELLFLLARNTAQHAKYHAEASKRPAELRMALHYNTLAEGCYSQDRAPQALWEQHAELARELDERTEAEALGIKATQWPLRPDKDYYLLAHGLVLEGNYRQALELLQKATQHDPRNFAAWFVRGNCYYELLRDGEAVASFNVCLGLRPSYSWAWLNRGLAHVRLHHHRQACEDFDEALRLDPNMMDGYLNRALAREEMGNFIQALEDLNKALEVGPACSRIYYRLARVYDKKGDKVEAKRQLSECIQSQPADEYDWIARGLAKKDEDPKSALADFDRALALNPRSFEGLQNKAALLSDKFGKDDEALRVLNEAVKHYPDSVLARGGRGILLARQSQRDDALTDAREALVLDPSPLIEYQVAGIYALTSKQNADDRTRALHLLSSALRAGAGLEWVDDDHDLDPLRKDPEFQRVVKAARSLQPAPLNAGTK